MKKFSNSRSGSCQTVRVNAVAFDFPGLLLGLGSIAPWTALAAFFGIWGNIHAPELPLQIGGSISLMKGSLWN